MSLKPETRAAIRDITKRVRCTEIPLRRRWSALRTLGERRSLMRGDGDDFDGHSEYQPGDDPRNIDWNATALSGGQQILVALYREPKLIRGYVLSSVDPSMNFGSTRVTKRHLAAEVAACAMKCMAETKDPVGVVAYSENGIERLIKPRPILTNTLPVLSTVLETEPGRATTKNGLAKALASLPRSSSIVFIVSDFVNMTEDDWAMLKKTAVRHQIYAFYVQDIRERELPVVSWPGCFYPIRDAKGNEELIWNNATNRKKYAENFRAHEAAICARLKASRCRYMVISTEQGDAAVPAVLRFFANP